MRRDLVSIHEGAQIIESTLGRYVDVGRDSRIVRSIVGNFVTIAPRVMVNAFNHPTSWLSCHEFQYHNMWDKPGFERLPRHVAGYPHSTIGNDVWIGTGAVIGAGVNIGNGAVVGANSVVTNDMPDFSISAGAPAKMIRYRFDKATCNRILATKWWDLDLTQLSGLPFNDIERCLDELERRASL